MRVHAVVKVCWDCLLATWLCCWAALWLCVMMNRSCGLISGTSTMRRRIDWGWLVGWLLLGRPLTEEACVMPHAVCPAAAA